MGSRQRLRDSVGDVRRMCSCLNGHDRYAEQNQGTVNRQDPSQPSGVDFVVLGVEFIVRALQQHVGSPPGVCNPTPAIGSSLFAKRDKKSSRGYLRICLRRGRVRGHAASGLDDTLNDRAARMAKLIRKFVQL
jgi:hypothetical protein